MKAMVDKLPRRRDWAGFGISRMQMPMVAQAMLLGGNVRVGLEDNLFLDKGVFASQRPPRSRRRSRSSELHGRAAADAGRGAQEARPAAAQLATRRDLSRDRLECQHPASSPIKTVGIVGGGVIGSGWAARCLAHGLDVIATGIRRPAPRRRLRDSVANAWPALTRVGPEARRQRQIA